MELYRKKRNKYIRWNSKNCRLVMRYVDKYPQNLQLGFKLAANRLSKEYGTTIAASAISTAYYNNKTFKAYKKIAIMSPIVCVVGNKIIDSRDLQKKKGQIHKVPILSNLVKILYEYFKKI